MTTGVCACGPDWLPENWIHWYLEVPEGEECFFHEACVQHDIDYEEGILSRKECDEVFFHKMTQMAIEKNASVEEKLRATKYYYWVRQWGWVSYYNYNGCFN